MRIQARPQLKNLRSFIGRLDSGRSDTSARYKEVLREKILPAKHPKPVKLPGK
jgi:hypothetical protein